MRVSTNLIHQKNLQGLLGNQESWLKSSTDLSSGKKIQSPSDDPLGASKAVLLRQAQSRNEQFQATRNSVNGLLSNEDAVLRDVQSVLHSAKETLVQVGNGTLNNDNRKALAVKLESLKEQLLSLGNSTHTSGDYIFSGAKTNQIPFKREDDGTVSYQGSLNTVKILISETREIDIRSTGNQVFPGDKDNNIFAALNNAIKTLNSEEIDSEQISLANKAVDSTLVNVSSIRAKDGSVLNEIEQLINIGENLEIQFTNEISGLEDIDVAEAISEFLKYQYSYQAAQKTVMNMQGMSLFQQS